MLKALPCKAGWVWNKCIIYSSSRHSCNRNSSTEQLSAFPFQLQGGEAAQIQGKPQSTEPCPGQFQHSGMDQPPGMCRVPPVSPTPRSCHPSLAGMRSAWIQNPRKSHPGLLLPQGCSHTALQAPTAPHWSIFCSSVAAKSGGLGFFVNFSNAKITNCMAGTDCDVV